MTPIPAATVDQWQAATAAGRVFTVSLLAEIRSHLGASRGIPALPVTRFRVSRTAGPGELSAEVTITQADLRGNDLRPTGWTSPVNVWGARVDLIAAVENPNQAPIYVPMGRGILVGLSDEWPGGELTLDIEDLTFQLEQCEVFDDLPEPAQRTQPLATLAQTIVTTYGRLGTLQGTNLIAAGTLPEDVSWPAGTNALEIVLSIIRTGNRQLVVTGDRAGALRVKALRTAAGAPPNTAPRAVVRSGEGGHLVTRRGTWSRRDAVNWVKVAATDPDIADATWSAEAVIANATPINATTGTLGIASRYITESLRGATKAYAQTVADFELGTSGGVPLAVTLTTTPMPWLDPGDVITVGYGGASETVQVVGWEWSRGQDGEHQFRLDAKHWNTQWGSGLPAWPISGGLA